MFPPKAKHEEHYLEHELRELMKTDSSVFRFIEQGALDGLWYWDLVNPENEWMNERFWTILGYDPSSKKHLADEWKDIIFEEDLEIAVKNFQLHCQDPNHPYDQIVRYRHKNGSVVWIRCLGLVVRDDKGQPIRMLGAHHDISKLKLAEEALKKEKERFDIAIKGASVGIWDWEDIAQEYVYWSPKFYELLGYENKEIQASFAFFADSLHPDDKEATLEAVKRHLEKDEPYDVEYRLKKKNGQYSWFRAVGSAIRDAEGKPTRMAGSIEDIDQRKHAEIDSEAAQERFRLVIQGASVGIWDWIDLKKDKQYWSPKFFELLGYEDGEITSSWENISQLIHCDDYSLTCTTLENHKKRGAPFDLELRLNTKHEGYRWFRAFGCVSRNNKGEAIRMVGSIADIHERKIAQTMLKEHMRKLADSNHDLEQFAYAASHDLQEPLRTISSYLRLIERRYEESLPEEAKEFFGIVKDSCQRMKTLISDLLTFSRIKRNHASFDSIGLSALIEKLVESYHHNHPEVTFHLAVPQDLIIKGIPSYIERLISNLIGNAIKYRDTDRPPVINIEAQLKSDNILISIKDNGIGIDSAYFEKIFGIFQRLHTMDQYEGTGIGLTICKRIAEIHGGCIHVESKQGFGSHFAVELPNNLSD